MSVEKNGISNDDSGNDGLKSSSFSKVESGNIPALRFKGFTDPWEQRKVKELLLERNELAPASDEYPLMAFVANEGVVSKGDRYDRSALVSDVVGKPYKKTELNDFIYSSNNLETGSIGLNKYGKASISPVYSIFCSTETADANFLGSRLTRQDFIGDMVKWRQGVIYGQWRIHESDFIKIDLVVPPIAEQRKIGKLFDKLDDLITLHQRKLEKTKQFKQAMLEKMFPKDGEDVPEVRFKGFTNPWEQRKLGEMFIEGDERSSAEEILSVSVANGIYPASESSRITDPGASIANYKVVRKGDIVYNSMRMWQGAVGSSRYDGIVSPAYVVARPDAEIDSSCFGYLLKRPQMLYKYLCESQGNSKDTQTLKYERFAEIEVEVAPTIKEQRTISECLESLDSLITLHQRKLDLLKNVKQSLLDKMFV